MSNPGDAKYETLTPVPPIPAVSASLGGYGAPVYAQHAVPFATVTGVAYPSAYGQQSGHPPGHPIGFLSTHGVEKVKVAGITEPDSSTPESHVTLENSFQVPSVSSTTTRAANGGQNAHPQHSQLAMYHSEHYQNQIPAAGPLPPSPHHIQPMQPTNVENWDQTKSVVVGQQAVAGQAMLQSTNASENVNNGEKVTKKKRKRCGECPGCLKKDNCGECGPCKSVRSHQICKMRKCDQLKTKKEKVREAL
ncbi:uncharacterized protein B4U80_03112 [Leptotrombidium deliense]|uniref:CXXC-type domain-containing protein n=1 Tax=Leptotrombidium deliense TaxID=299467 RepID=A0A443SSM6_9ACAR|nr:uncharacterized protein B4U80_03112 [Leptotrombidium deliense]